MNQGYPGMYAGWPAGPKSEQLQMGNPYGQLVPQAGLGQLQASFQSFQLPIGGGMQGFASATPGFQGLGAPLGSAADLAERLGEQLMLGDGSRGPWPGAGGLSPHDLYYAAQQQQRGPAIQLTRGLHNRGMPGPGQMQQGMGGMQVQSRPQPLPQPSPQQQQQQQQQGGQQPRRRNQKGMEDNIKRTIYVSYIDLQVTEEQLATFFSECGQVVDCRICGDANSAMRFAFLEFLETDSAQRALSKNGTMLGGSPLRVLPSKTAIMPVSKDLMPRSHDEIERCSRTVYVANIDKKVDRSDVRAFFEQLCGAVSKLRLLGDYAHTTRIAFIEFVHADGAMAALNCSGALLGSLPIRVSPSKTPVRSEAGAAPKSGGAVRSGPNSGVVVIGGAQGGGSGAGSTPGSSSGAAAAAAAAGAVAAARVSGSNFTLGGGLGGEDGVGVGSVQGGRVSLGGGSVVGALEQLGVPYPAATAAPAAAAPATAAVPATVAVPVPVPVPAAVADVAGGDGLAGEEGGVGSTALAAAAVDAAGAPPGLAAAATDTPSL